MNKTEEDITFDDKISDDTIVCDAEIPKEVRKISTQAYDKSVADVVRMIQDNEINLNPEYQRNYIWDNKRASLLVESIILNVPIPVIYVSQEEDDTWTVIDGLQRLNSLSRFFERDFKLSGLEILTELNRCDIKSLPIKACRMLKNGLLRIIVITHDSNEEIKYDIFMRLNRGSVHLNEQELRNCLYRGRLNELLKRMSNNQNWQNLLGLTSPHKRMVDCEMILRFIALSEKWDKERKEIEGYKGRMKIFLNEFMYENKNIDANKGKDWENLFTNTVEKTILIFGKDAFKRINVDGTVERSINRAIMDAIMLSFISYSKAILESHSQTIRDAFISLIINDSDYKKSILIGTSDKKVINYRIDTWCSVLDRIISNGDN